MGRHILVIDDNQSLLALFRILFTAEGYEAALYSDPNQALAALDQTKPDLILLDWFFDQQARGRQLLEDLTRNPATAAIPVVICTAGLPMLPSDEAFLCAAGIAVVYKPFAVDALLAVITNALQGDRSPGARPADGAELGSDSPSSAPKLSTLTS